MPPKAAVGKANAEKKPIVRRPKKEPEPEPEEEVGLNLAVVYFSRNTDCNLGGRRGRRGRGR